jgi:hypothetical protein
MNLPTHRLSLLPVLAACLLSASALAQEARTSTIIHTRSTSPFGRKPVLRTWVQGWELTGSRVDAYELRCDDYLTSCAVPILRTRPEAGEPLGMGSLTHAEGAESWRGRRVEVAAELRPGSIGGWAGLWMRVDGAEGKVLAFDNMQNRPLRGTSGYAWYSVVLDVPAEAERISFGVLLHGPGAVFIRELRFDDVGESVAATDLLAPLRPQARASTPAAR